MEGRRFAWASMEWRLASCFSIIGLSAISRRAVGRRDWNCGA